jgi:hypothetical protein
VRARKYDAHQQRIQLITLTFYLSAFGNQAGFTTFNLSACGKQAGFELFTLSFL